MTSTTFAESAIAPRNDRALVTQRGLWLVCLAFLAWRLPSMYLEPGWQDEDCYAIPGQTILQSGVPQLPNLPSRNLESPYYRADEVVFLEPPLFFYLQAAYYALLPDFYVTARLASAMSGVLLLLFTGGLAMRCGDGGAAAVWGMGLFMMSRWFYFHASAARPDVTCAVWGLVAVLTMWFWTRSHRPRWLMASGVAIGLGGLTHPFALAYAVQMACWVCLAARGWMRLFAPTALALTAVLTTGLWLPLILQHQDVFAVQFRNQFLHERGGSLAARWMSPWESLAFHVGFLWPHLGWWQFLLPIAGALGCLWFGRREGRPLLAAAGWLSLSGFVLIMVLVGPHHPVFGYFTYPAALAFVGVGWVVDRGLRAVWSQGRLGQAAAVVLGVACIFSLLPGSRIRMNLAFLRNCNQIDFNAPRFAQSVLDRLPPDATYVVDEEFMLDFLVAGRRAIAFRALVERAVPADYPYDYRVASRSTDRYFPHLTWNDELAWEAGDPSDPYACYVKVYRALPRR